MTALAMVLTLGPAERFRSPRQVASYFGLIPSEHSSGGRQKLGQITKQGNWFVRFLLVEAGQSAVQWTWNFSAKNSQPRMEHGSNTDEEL